jgi:hypothetical protein
MRRSTWVVAIAVPGFVALSLSCFLTARQVGPAAVPNPIVTGPIPATASPGDPWHNYPFLSTTVDLASRGYVEEEFFLEGTANRYNMPAPEDVTATATVSGSDPYRTRMIVRRPRSPERFSGTVLMEWQNVTAGYELDAVWVNSWEHIVRRGYAWVGVSAQRVGVHQAGTGLKAWSPARYGTLDVTRGGTITDDALCYDIYSQAAQAVRRPSGVDPMGDLAVKRVFAVGVSQGAARLVRYHNHIHPRAGVFDAFIAYEGGVKLRTDLDVKVLKVLSETDVAGMQANLRQPDSNHFRRWEVAGSSHLDFHARQGLDPLQARDLGGSPSRECTQPPFSRIPIYMVGNAALDALVAWVRDGVEPAAGPDIVTPSVTPTSAEIARDSFGDALGGIRLSQLEVPTATNTGLNSGSGFCSLYGSYQPFDAKTLAALYRDHDTYVRRVAQVAQGNVKRGFIVQEDAEATIREAAQSSIGKR